MKKGSILKFILIFSFFAVALYVMISEEKKFHKYSDKLLKNDVEFYGIITSLERSNNHAFGVIGINVTKSTTLKFRDSTKKEIFPYRIKDNYAEVYATVNTSRKLGESIKVVSKENTIYYLSTKDPSEIGDLFLISDETNKRFIENHTKIKQ